jgi:type VI secretion system secreted protein Hcp
MAIDMFLKLEGVDGEAVTKGQEDEIQLMSIDWGMHQTGTLHTGTGAGAGKVDVTDISVSKKVCKASPVIMKHCMTGKSFTDAIITVRKAGGTEPLKYLVLKLSPILITSQNFSGSDGSEEIMEHLTINFAKVEVIYQQQNAEGGKEGGEVKAGYDIPGATEIT